VYTTAGGDRYFSKIHICYIFENPKKDPPTPFEAEKYQSTFRNLQKYTQDPLFSPNSTKSTFRILHKNTPTPQKSISKVVSVVLQDVSVQIRAVQNKADKVYCNTDCTLKYYTFKLF